MRRFALICLMMTAALPMQAQTGPAFMEFSAIAGGLVKPSGRSFTGFGFGVGRNKNQVSVEGDREFLSNYQLGVGDEFNTVTALPNRPGSYPVSTSPASSVVETFGGTFQRDLLNGHKGGFAVYGLGGLSYVRSKSSTAVFAQPLANAFPNDAPFLMQVYGAPSTLFIPVFTRVKTFGIPLGGGVRVPVAKGIGIRVELRTRWNHGGASTYGNSFVPVLDANGKEIVVNGFRYGIGDRLNPGPTLKSDTFLGVTLGLYYRIFNRRV